MLISVGGLLLAAAPVARANIDFTPQPKPFTSEVGKWSQPQVFRVSATCNLLFGSFCTEDTITINPSITPGSGGDFFIGYSDCPATMTGDTPDPHPSCSVSVRFAPRAVGTSTAILHVGSGSNGQSNWQLVGTGTPSTKVKSASASGKSKCKKRKAKHRAAASAKKKKCRAKKKSR
jgi:hypothetical protein